MGTIYSLHSKIITNGKYKGKKSSAKPDTYNYRIHNIVVDINLLKQIEQSIYLGLCKW